MLPLGDDNPTYRRPFVTWLLIAANVVVFLWQVNSGLERSVARHGFVPGAWKEWDGSELAHLFTCMFLHGGWLHLLGNMWFLHVFGDNVEDEMGHFPYLSFYLLTGVLATLAHYVTEPSSPIPLVGASGAISGVLGAYLVRHPKASIKTWTGFWIAPIIELPAIVFLAIWIGFQVLSAMATSATGGGVAYWAHFGGLAAGVVLVFFFTSGNSEKPRYRGY